MVEIHLYGKLRRHAEHCRPAQDCVVLEEDCGTRMGVEGEPLMEGGEIIQRLGERVLGRVAIEDIVDPFTDEVICSAADEIDELVVQKIEEAGFAFRGNCAIIPSKVNAQE